MMKINFKNILSLLIIVVVCGMTAVAQDAKTATKNEKTPKKIEVVRDRLMFDMFHSFWLGMPKEVDSMKFDPGFNITMAWDFKMPNNPSLSFGLGIGFSYYTQFSNAILKSEDQDVMKYYIIPSGIDYKVNKINYVNFHIPVEFRYRNPNNKFKVSVGARVGVVARISQRYRGEDPCGNGMKLNYKSLEIYNKQKYNVDVLFRIGWNCVGFYASYQINKLFEAGKGPGIHPITIGLTWSLF